MSEAKNWIDVAGEGDIPVGGFATVDKDWTTIAVFRLEDGYYAIDDLCTHEEEVLTNGEVDGDQIVCCRHGARFSIRTGAALTPPAYEPVKTYPVRVEAGRIQVGVDD